MVNKITSDDLGVFIITTQSGNEYTINRPTYGQTVLREHNQQFGQRVSIINCTVNEPAVFGFFPDIDNPEDYYLYHTTPISTITPITTPNTNIQPSPEA